MLLQFLLLLRLILPSTVGGDEDVNDAIIAPYFEARQWKRKKLKQWGKKEKRKTEIINRSVAVVSPPTTRPSSFHKKRTKEKKSSMAS